MASDLIWKEVNPQTKLTAEQLAKYEAYKEAYASMKAIRTAFEDSMQAGVPAGYRLLCGYKFGKLSIAIGEDTRRPIKASANSIGSLADFIAAQTNSGRRV